MQVLHLCSMAIETILEGKRNKSNSVCNLKDVKWAFILGMYWIFQDWFLYRVAEAIEHCEVDDDASVDKEFIVCIYNQLFEPFQTSASFGTLTVSREWIEVKCRPEHGSEEDYLAITLAVELNWYCASESGEWNTSLNNWIEACPIDCQLRARLETLQARLRFQTGVFTGEAFKPQDPASLPISDPIQRDLFSGWIAYHNCNWKQLNHVIDSLRRRISVDHIVFVPLFFLLHSSRYHRGNEAENQFASLPRMLFARSRQKQHMFQYVRELHAEELFAELAVLGFPQNAKAAERKACMRMAMMISLQALRDWNIGAWRTGMQLRARSLLELGLAGHTLVITQSLIDSVRAHSVPELGKDSRFLTAIRLLDCFTEEARINFVKALLISPRIEWRYVHKIFCEFADSIPEAVLPDVAQWSLNAETTDLIEDLFTHTLLEFWGGILPRSAQGPQLVAQLAPVLKKAIINPSHWRDLEDVFVSAIICGTADVSEELASLLISTPCEEPHWNDYRFSIVHTVLKSHGGMQDKLFGFAKSVAEKRNDIFHLRLIEKLKPQEQTPKSDLEYRQKLINQIVTRIDERANLPGPSFSIGSPNFFAMGGLVDWDDGASEVTEKVISAINSETVLLSDKGAYLAFLVCVVRTTSDDLKRRISTQAMTWLQGGVAGRQVGGPVGGPLSAIQISGSHEQGIAVALIFLVQECAICSAESIRSELTSWLLANAFYEFDSYSEFHLLKTVFATVRACAKADDDRVSLIAGLATTLGTRILQSKPTHAVGAFHEIVLDECIADFELWADANKPWMRGILNQWVKILGALSTNIDPEVRRCVAAATFRWQQTKLPHPVELLALKFHFEKDARMRVRLAISGRRLIDVDAE